MASMRQVTKVSSVISCNVRNMMPGGFTHMKRCFSQESGKDFESIGQFDIKDGNFENYSHRPEEGGITSVDPTNRAFTYTLLGGAKFMTASAVRVAAVKVLSTLYIGKADLALAQTEVPLGDISPGDCISIKWRGNPAFVKCRSEEEIRSAQAVDWKSLRDPQADEERTQGNDPKWVCVMANCTHLGCIPLANAGNYDGFFCPCHGSHYDNCGRIRQGPAPLNLMAPPYTVNGDLMIVG